MVTRYDYIRYRGGPTLYVVVQRKTEFKHWFVGVYVCDTAGDPVGDAVDWDICLTRLSARKKRKQLYKDFDRYVNRRC